MTDEEMKRQINAIPGAKQLDKDAHIWLDCWRSVDHNKRRFQITADKKADMGKLIKVQEIMCEWVCSYVEES